MGNTAGQIVTTPVNSDDVVAATSYNNHDWGHFCSASNSNINKWSLWKPYRCAGESSPTNLQVVQMKFGIDVSTARHTGLENAIKSSSNPQPDPDSLTAPSGAYAYLRPLGGAASPYRITDYADDDDPTATANGVYFKRQYDRATGSPDEWLDWKLTEAQLTSLMNKKFSSIPGGTSWELPDNDKGIVYSNCSIRLGPQSHEVIGYRPNAMPLNYLFGDNRIANEKWRLGLAVFLPNGTGNSASSPRWMVFAGNKPLSTANGGGALPFTGSNIELLQAIYHNFKYKGVKVFKFFPCILLNCTLIGSTSNGTDYITRVDMSSISDPTSPPTLLVPPSFSKCELTIEANTPPGHVVQYSDNSFRGAYATNITSGTYNVVKTRADHSGSGYTSIQRFYMVETTGATIEIEHVESGAYGGSGNLELTASGSNLKVTEFGNPTDLKNNRNPTVATKSVAVSAAMDYFATYIGAEAPYSISLTLDVTKIS